MVVFIGVACGFGWGVFPPLLVWLSGFLCVSFVASRCLLGLLLLLAIWLLRAFSVFFCFCLRVFSVRIGLVCEVWGVPLGGGLLERCFDGSVGVSCTIVIQKKNQLYGTNSLKIDFSYLKI